MTQHAAFGTARRATRIDEAAGLARLLACHFSQDDLVLDALGGGKEVFPEEETRPRDISRKCGLTPDNESSHFIVLVNVNSEALEVLSRLDNDDFGLCVLGLIQACFSLISDIDASVDLVVHDATHEGHGPLRGVETHDSDSRAGRAAKLVTRFRKLERILPVLVPGPANLNIVALDPQCGAVTSSLNGICKVLAQGDRSFRAAAGLAHLDR